MPARSQSLGHEFCYTMVRTFLVGMFSGNICACDMWYVYADCCEPCTGDKDKAWGTTGSVYYSFYHNLLLENIPATKYFAIRMVECVGLTAI